MRNYYASYFHRIDFVVILSYKNFLDTTLYQRYSTLFRCCLNGGHWRCINIVQGRKFDVGFCFIFSVGLTLFPCWYRNLKQRWSDVEIFGGIWHYKERDLKNCERYILNPFREWIFAKKGFYTSRYVTLFSFTM